jgi:PPOX class probable F420-dependent enzyme
MTDECYEMSQDQIDAFLMVPRLAVLGTNRVNGPPQLTPIWYLYEEGLMYVSMSVSSVKYRNLVRDPRISICVAGEHPDARGVMIVGKAKFIVEENDWHDEMDWRLVRRYHDSDEQARAYASSMAEDDASAIAVITPERILGQDYN